MNVNINKNSQNILGRQSIKIDRIEKKNINMFNFNSGFKN